MLDEEFLEKLHRTYATEELPPHPSWCARADRPRQACATRLPDGRFSDAEHTSAVPKGPEPHLYLVRGDSAGFGVGAVQVGFLCGDEEHHWEPREARAIAYELLDVAEAAEAAQAAAHVPV